MKAKKTDQTLTEEELTALERLFGEMCEESLIRQYEQEMANNQESAAASPEHYAKVSKILGYEVTGPIRD